MTRTAARARLARLALSFLALASCGGESIRLGDANPETSGAASSGGAAGLGVGGVGVAGSLGNASGAGGSGQSGSAGNSAGSSAAGGTAGSGGNSTGGTEDNAGSGGDPSAGADSGGAAGAGETCLPGQVAANEVLWIGDTWVMFPNEIQLTRVRDLARAAQTIGEDEAYDSRAAAATRMADIAAQYAQRQAETPVKVLLMDGGTWDTYLDGASADSIERVRSTFEDFLAEVDADGTVENIVYLMIPNNPGVRGVEELRPELRAACANSAVPCYFINLEDDWDLATDSVGIQPSETGARKIGDAVWAVMQENCVAQ